MVSVRVTDIYDLSTQVGKIGLVAVHTPGVQTIYSLWKGLFDNYRFYRIASCDVHLACAQTLPADPLQVGTEAGTIAPQDLFNPILYKAVSNESFNTVLARLNTLSDVTSAGWGLSTVSEGDLMAYDEDGSDGFTVDDMFKTYYGLLADGDGWKKAMPQSGLSMRALFPMVYQVVNTFGNEVMGRANYTNVPLAALDKASSYPADDVNDSLRLTDKASTFRGHAMRMPRLPTKSVHYVTGTNTTTVDYTQCPLTYVMCLLTPPAKQVQFYYRMRVTWTIEFEELRPLTDTMTFSQIGNVGATHYATDYADQSKLMDSKTDLVDAKDVDLEKVMSAGK